MLKISEASKPLIFTESSDITCVAMSKLRSHIVIVGGPLQTEEMLFGVAEAAIAIEMANDPVVFTFNDARRKEKLLSVAARTAGIILTHGAGSVAIPGNETLESVIMIAPHEPIARLGQAVVRNSFDHLIGNTAQPRRDHLRVLADNVMALGVNPIRNLSGAGIASGFSTYKLVQGGHIHSDCIGYFPMSEDRFYESPSTANLLNLEWHGHIADVLRGGHDELMLDPGNVLINAQNKMRDGQSIAWARIGARQ